MDYTDLNKACPKDSYPLSSIDRLVDGSSRYCLLSFMDAYDMHPCHNLNCDVRLGEPRPCRPQRSHHRRFGLGNARKPNGKAGLESEIWVRELVAR
ncbi:hypothetical protein CR513_35131, partial [Mucuna pruriens]